MKNSNIVSFRSKYLVKIIDYGRSFFKDDENKKNSDIIYKKCVQHRNVIQTVDWIMDSHIYLPKNIQDRGFSLVVENVI